MNPIYRGQEPPKNTNVLWIKGKKILVYTDNGWEETSTDAFTIDDSMVPNSENPVQSKVIQNSLLGFQQSATQQINTKQDIVTLDTSLSESSVNMIENKAVYDQYMDEEDVDDIYRIFDPTYGLKAPCARILEDGTITIRTINQDGDLVTNYTKTIYYKKNDDTTWTQLNFGSGTSTQTINVVAGDKITFGGNENAYSNSSLNHLNIKINVNCNLVGNAMALINKEDPDSITALPNAGYNFFGLFEGSKIIDASNFLLPATTLQLYCYMSMFKDCTSLTKAPNLPAETAKGYCYGKMFYGCTSLTDPPVISMTVTDEDCCEDMFENCTSLVTAPALPALTIKRNCYGHMFRGCTSLINPPALPATTLAKSCYGALFKNCTSLVTAPELPASYVENSAYSQLFMGCSSLNYIKCLATGFSSSATYQWTDGVAYTGTFVKANGSSWQSGIYGIPYNWTVETV